MSIQTTGTAARVTADSGGLTQRQTTRIAIRGLDTGGYLLHQPQQDLARRFRAPRHIRTLRR
jgi:hypothetical protein